MGRGNPLPLDPSPRTVIKQQVRPLLKNPGYAPVIIKLVNLYLFANLSESLLSNLNLEPTLFTLLNSPSLINFVYARLKKRTYSQQKYWLSVLDSLLSIFYINLHKYIPPQKSSVGSMHKFLFLTHMAVIKDQR